MQPIDLSSMRVIDLSQNWNMDTPGFATYEGPTIKWIKRVAFDKVGGQYISSTLHVGTHLDAPRHFITNGQDIGSIPLDKLVGPGVVVDLEALGIGDYDIYTSPHFAEWERKTGLRIQALTGTIPVTSMVCQKQSRRDISSSILSPDARLSTGCWNAKFPGLPSMPVRWITR